MEGCRTLALGVELFRRAEAQIRFALTEEPLRIVVIDLLAVRLTIRAVVTAAIWALFPIQAEPFEIVDELALEALFAALYVRVFDAQDVGPAESARYQPVEQSRAGVADVELPRRRRCETYTDIGCGGHS